ncbi:MAG: T9SS type A sorting domain-containing protein, partial [Owenweeksia sp.]
NKALGLNDTEDFKEVDIEVYPNPGPGKYNVNVKIPEAKSLELLVLDQSGKQVLSRDLKNSAGSFKSDIDISDKAKGLYFLVLKSGTRSQVEKLIKE